MKFDVQYVNDANGNPKAILLPIADCEKVLAILNEYERSVKKESVAVSSRVKLSSLKGKTSRQDNEANDKQLNELRNEWQ